MHALLQRYPDDGPDAGTDSPWSVVPVEVRGPLAYLPMAWSRSAEVSTWIVRVAKDHGLNCYDPQHNEMLTPYRQRWRFKLTTARGRSLRDPGPDRVREALVRLSNDAYYAVLTRADDWYVQVGYGERAGHDRAGTCWNAKTVGSTSTSGSN